MILKLDTGLEKYGNDSGMQIDTLAMAVDGYTYNDIEEMNNEHVFHVENYAVLEYNHEADFLATLDADTRARYADDLDAFRESLAAYKEEIEESRISGNLSEDHPYQKAIDNARDSVHENMYHEWLHGDRSDPGLLYRAQKYLSDSLNVDIDLSYDEKNDVLSVEIENDEDLEYLLQEHELAPWRLEDRTEDQSYSELADEQAKEQEAVAKMIAGRIEEDAAWRLNKRREENKRRREENEKLREYRAGLKAAEEEALRKRIKGS